MFPCVFFVFTAFLSSHSAFRRSRISNSNNAIPSRAASIHSTPLALAPEYGVLGFRARNQRSPGAWISVWGASRRFLGVFRCATPPATAAFWRATVGPPIMFRSSRDMRLHLSLALFQRILDVSTRANMDAVLRHSLPARSWLSVPSRAMAAPTPTTCTGGRPRHQRARTGPLSTRTTTS